MVQIYVCIICSTCIYRSATRIQPHGDTLMLFWCACARNQLKHDNILTEIQISSHNKIISRCAIAQDSVGMLHHLKLLTFKSHSNSIEHNECCAHRVCTMRPYIIYVQLNLKPLIVERAAFRWQQQQTQAYWGFHWQTIMLRPKAVKSAFYAFPSSEIAVT